MLNELESPIVKLSKDLRKAAKDLKESEVRFLVSSYYAMQSDRIRSDARARQLDKVNEPHEILKWLGEQSGTLEKQLKSVLHEYVKNHIMGEWLLSNDGIGPVISAGLLAHIDINIAKYAGQIWSFAGIAHGVLDEMPLIKVLPKNATLEEIHEEALKSYKVLYVCNGILYYTTPDDDRLKCSYIIDNELYWEEKSIKGDKPHHIKDDVKLYRTFPARYEKTEDVIMFLEWTNTLEPGLYTEEDLMAFPLFPAQEIDLIRKRTNRISYKWEKGTKRPWNAELKTLCWKAGESFVLVSNKETAVYGNMYAQKKQVYLEKNERGGFALNAAKRLENYNISKDTDAYKAYIQGKLPPAHVHSMAKRYATKMFLSHFHSVWYEKHHGVPAPMPFVIQHLGHADYIPPPNHMIGK